MLGWGGFWGALTALFVGGEVFTRSWRLWPFAAASALALGLSLAEFTVGIQWAAYALAAAVLPFVASRLTGGLVK